MVKPDKKVGGKPIVYIPQAGNHCGNFTSQKGSRQAQRTLTLGNRAGTRGTGTENDQSGMAEIPPVELVGPKRPGTLFPGIGCQQ